MRTALTRQVAILGASVAVVMGSATSAAADPEPGPGPTQPPMECPYGLPLQMTVAEALVHYAGSFTEEQIRAGFALKDSNENGYFCYREDHRPGHPLYPALTWFSIDDFGGADPG